MAENSGEIIPQPELEIAEETQTGREALSERALERRTPAENRQAKRSPQFTPQLADDQTAVVPAQLTATQTAQVKPATYDLSAKEGDRIEREWVDRAKSIVAQTRDDPYRQKKEMSRIKADYIKKRFDKTIPADDAVGV